jgi:FkbM family methyltransferase
MKERIVEKGRQILSFCKHSRTSAGLILDSLRLKRTPFVAVSEDGLKVRLKARSGESYTFYENLIRKDHLNHGITLGPGATVVDIGANIAAFVILAASIVAPRGRLIAIEPVAETFERLQENVALNGLENIACIIAAVDGQECSLTIRTNHKSAYATAYHLNSIGDDAPGTTVPCLTLGRIFQNFRLDRIDLLKDDCEGSEYAIFDSLSPDLAARVDQIGSSVLKCEAWDFSLFSRSQSFC